MYKFIYNFNMHKKIFLMGLISIISLLGLYIVIQKIIILFIIIGIILLGIPIIYLVLKQKKIEIIDTYIEIENVLKKFSKQSNLSMITNSQHGHLSSNILFKNASLEKKIIKELSKLKCIDKIEVVKGYINIFLNITNLHINFEIKNKEKILIEYVSPNPTGPLHLGHLRNIIIGSSLVNLYKHCGYDVTTEMYINDQGNQMNQFIESVNYYRDGSGILYYQGEYVKQFAKYSNEEIMNQIISGICTDLSKLNIQHDNIIFESSLNKEVIEIHHMIDKLNLLYIGFLDDTSKEESVIINTVQLGDDKNRVLQRKNKIYTYFAYDIAYHYHKYLRGYNKLITVLGEDHIGHMKKLSMILNQMNIYVNIVSYNHVFYKKDDQLLALSKRQGNIITLKELLERFTSNELRWIILSQNAHKIIEFDQNYSLDPLYQIMLASERIQMFIIDNTLPSVCVNLVRYVVSFNSMLQSACYMNDTHKVLEFLVKLSQEILLYFRNHVHLNNSTCNVYDSKILNLCSKIFEKSFNILGFEKEEI